MPRVRQQLTELVGKTISGVVLKESAERPQHQLFLVFSDNTYYEIYSYEDRINSVKSFGDGGIDGVLNYMSDERKVLLAAYEEEGEVVVKTPPGVMLD